MTVRPAEIRHRIDPADVPAVKAARRLHLTLSDFETKLPELLKRGFPPADPTTGMYFLPAIDKWMADRHALTRNPEARNPPASIRERLERAKWAG